MALRHLNPRHLRLWSGSRLLFTAFAALGALGLAFALVAVALRRFRRQPSAEAMVVEEREALVSLRSAAGAFAAALGRRLRRRLPARRRDPRSPAELVRRRYAELEQRLAGGGRPRPAGATVRDHLAAAAPASADAGRGPVEGDEPAAELAAIYELARYSHHSVDASQARRFEALARAFGA